MKVVESIADITNNVLDKFVADKDLKTKLSHDLEKEILKLNQKQLEVNKAEAMSGNWFASSWRPLIGYICGFAMGWHFILEPILQYILILNGVQFETPEFDFAQLSTILMAMLGMSTLRTYERTKNVHRQ